MNGMGAYQLFRAMKLHFTSEKYDYFKYGGKTKAIDPVKFETRRDRYQYEKLARHRDPVNLLVANFIDNDIRWVGDIEIGCYESWKGRQQALTYNFTQECRLIEDDLNGHLKVIDGQHPKLFMLYVRGDVSHETMIMLDAILGFSDYWSASISEKIVWPKAHTKLKKYRPFVKFDVDNAKKILHNTITS